MSKIKIDIRVSDTALSEMFDFVSMYQHETINTLIQKSMQRYIRAINQGVITERETGLEKGDCKIHSKVNELTVLLFKQTIESLGFFCLSDAIRASIRHYMLTEPLNTLKPLRIEKPATGYLIDGKIQY